MNHEPNDYPPMKPLSLGILLALGDQPHHGYSLMRALQQDDRWTGPVHTGPLYRMLKQLLEDGLVEARAEAPAGVSDDPRRGSYYSLSALGRSVLAAELARLARVVEAGKRLDLAEGSPS